VSLFEDTVATLQSIMDSVPVADGLSLSRHPSAGPLRTALALSPEQRPQARSGDEGGGGGGGGGGGRVEPTPLQLKKSASRGGLSADAMAHGLASIGGGDPFAEGSFFSRRRADSAPAVTKNESKKA
jgi:hypothetical protein